MHSVIYFSIVIIEYGWNNCWLGINFMCFQCRLHTIPSCFLGSADTPFNTFYLLTHRLLWILPGIAHSNGAHIAQFTNHETLRDTMSAKAIIIGIMLCDAQDAVFSENRIKTAQIVTALAQIGHGNPCLQ